LDFVAGFGGAGGFGMYNAGAFYSWRIGPYFPGSGAIGSDAFGS
jgi:hypothetical protein